MENSSLDKMLDMWKLNLDILIGLFVLSYILDNTTSSIKCNEELK